MSICDVLKFMSALWCNWVQPSSPLIILKGVPLYHLKYVYDYDNFRIYYISIQIQRYPEIRLWFNFSWNIWMIKNSSFYSKNRKHDFFWYAIHTSPAITCEVRCKEQISKMSDVKAYGCHFPDFYIQTFHRYDITMFL